MLRIKFAAAMAAGAMIACSAVADVRTAYLPPVPDGWSVRVDNTTVVYSSAARNEQNGPLSQVKFTYSRSTHGLDAAGVADEYIERNRCSPKVEQGKGFYTSGCKLMGTDVIVIGEVNNVYRIEVTGSYSREVTMLLNKYVNDIVRGKRTFEDRDIGEKYVEKKLVYLPPKMSSDEDEAAESSEESGH